MISRLVISRLDRLQGRDIYENTALAKINELIDAVNAMQNLWLEVATVKKIILELQTKAEILEEHAHTTATTESADPYEEQRKWIGKLCRFWDDDEEEKCFSVLEYIHKNSPYPYCARDEAWFKHCELVKPDDDIIYKGV